MQNLLVYSTTRLEDVHEQQQEHSGLDREHLILAGSNSISRTLISVHIAGQTREISVVTGAASDPEVLDADGAGLSYLIQCMDYETYYTDS